MASFGKKKTYTEYLYTKPVLVVLSIAVLFLGVAVVKRYTIERDMYDRRVAIEEEKEALIDRKTQLEEKVEYLEGQRGIEEEIRKHFDVAREGEQVVILVGESEMASEDDVEEEVIDTPWYIFWR